MKHKRNLSENYLTRGNQFCSQKLRSFGPLPVPLDKGETKALGTRFFGNSLDLLLGFRTSTQKGLDGLTENGVLGKATPYPRTEILLFGFRVPTKRSSWRVKVGTSLA